jgi:hypothetical protein
LRSSLVFAAALAAFLAALLAGSATALDRTGDPAKWLTFWTPMMPVFMHDRCFNCHNKVNPRLDDSKNNHGGGQLELPEQFACIGCHTANTTVVEGTCELDQFSGKGKVSLPDGKGKTLDATPCVPNEGPKKIRIPIGPVWNARGPDFSEDMPELCRMVKNRKTPEQLVEHVQNDALIDFAFKGTAGMDEQSQFWPPELETPPLTKPEFVNLLTRWITEAAMACSTDGTIVLAEKVTIDMPLSPFGGASVRKSVDATIDIKSGVATSKLRYKEESTSAAAIAALPCKAKDNAEVHSSAEGKPDTQYQIDIGPGGVYRLRFFLGSIEAQTGYSAEADVCRPIHRRRGELPTEPTAEQEFDVQNQQAERSPTDPGVWILKGSTPVDSNKGLAMGGATIRGERTVTWDIVIQ